MAKPKPKGGGLPKLPPFMSYPPAINAQRRAQARGLKDILKDTKRAKGQVREDASQKITDIGTSSARGYQDLALRHSRGVEDVTQRVQRGEEDFSESLGNLIRGFQTKGREQTQAANQAGVLGGSYEQAAAARRAEGLASARRPLDINRARMHEDAAQTLSRLGEDVSLAGSRLGEDTTRDTSLVNQDLQRSLTDLMTKRRRAIREQRIGNLDLINEAIFEARQLKPGAFNRYGAQKQPKKRR